MGDFERWKADGVAYGWVMPAAPWWKRLPVVRHVRAVWNGFWVEVWYRKGPGSLGLRTGYDNWVLWGIAHGHERRTGDPSRPPVRRNPS